MKRIIINGQKKLLGEVEVSGSKNAALPIIFATLLTDGISEIRNLPDIGDVRVALEIISHFGAVVQREGNACYIDTRQLSYSEPPSALVDSIRASTYLIGASLARFGECTLSTFGGCNFAFRPIDLHILAAKRLGATEQGDKLIAKRLFGNEINLAKASVGATVNSILLAATADGETVIRGFAKEPHIDALIEFLISAGAEIERTNTEIRISGRHLHGGEISVIGDMIEAGSYLAAGIISGGSVTVKNCPTRDMNAFFDFTASLGARSINRAGSVTSHLFGIGKSVSVTAAPYPAFPTDLQPIVAPLMANNDGGRIRDTVWQTRFGYLDALRRFGVNSFVSGDTAEIYQSRLHAASVSAPDLRGGMACLLSALVAEGESRIDSAETILRGYENLEQKMRSLGADIKILEF